MTLTWKKRDGNPVLTLVVCGFGMDANAFAGLRFGDSDLLVLSDFSRLQWTKEERESLTPYARIDVLAWSLGVWVWGQLAPALEPRPGTVIAVNGTLKPRHPQWGILPPMFDLTLRRFDQTSREAFYRNVWSEGAEFAGLLPQRDWQNQRAELDFLRCRLLEDDDQAPSPVVFSHAIGGRNDRIFPFASQQRFWEGRTPFTAVEAGHSPFHLWPSWPELLGSLRP